MTFLKNYFLWIILCGVAAYAAYFFITLKGPCDTPLEYTLGTFDSRFDISKAQFLDDISQAGSIWDKVLNKNLFAYDPTGAMRGDMPINLIYDSRQQLANTDANLTSNVSQTEQSADSIKQQFTDLQNQYKQSQSQYQALLAQYTQEQNAYNTEVNSWNAKGGAPSDQYAKLNQEKAALATQENTVEQERIATNALASQVNALISKYNYLVDDANTAIGTINQNADQQFEEGEYLTDSGSQTINIYEFQSNQNLIRVLAHEMGHSLGLGHNTNPDSIMYYLNTSTNMVPTPEDVAALKAACHIK